MKMTKLVATIAVAYTILIFLECAQTISARLYTVGNNNGWGPGNDYTRWIRGKRFRRDDVLVFRYTEGYSVDEVTATQFRRCDRTRSIFSAADGHTQIRLRKSGIHYFIGGAFEECAQGMNLTITVN